MSIIPRGFTNRLRAAFAPRTRTCDSAECKPDTTVWRKHLRPRPRVQLHGPQFCLQDCLERELRRRLQQLSVPPIAGGASSRRVPLGLMMLSRGELTAEQLRHAVDLQNQAGSGRIGEWLRKLGYTDDEGLTAALARQWCCPTIKSLPTSVGNCTIPFYLLQRFRMAPVHFSNSRETLYIAFAEKIAYRALLAIEQILQCKTEICITSCGEIDAALSRLDEHTRRADKLFENITSEQEVTRIISSYAATLQASEIRLGLCGKLVWSRITGNKFSEDLIFSPAATNAPYIERSRATPKFSVYDGALNGSTNSSAPARK